MLQHKTPRELENLGEKNYHSTPLKEQARDPRAGSHC